MSDTYSQHADICTKFYELTLDSKSVAEFVSKKVSASAGQTVLFVGGMFDVADELTRMGLQLTLVDYTDEMVAAGKRRLPTARVLKADLKALPFSSEFDLVLVVGRVFTHMILDAELQLAIESCKRALRPSGCLFADNYESNRIQKTNYFNGEVSGRDGDTFILRNSTTERVSELPFVVNWTAEYSGQFRGKDFYFKDSMEHRAFSRGELAQALSDAGLNVLEQGDNFDETSFYTVAQNTA